jgi:hypothetical protein
VSRLDEVLGTALLKGKRAQGEGREVVKVPLEALVPSPQPRRRFENLEALAESIREKGVLQPLLVRPLGDGRYAIVAGERRYRAAKMAGLAEVPVRVLDLPEKEARLLALVENLQREDLNPYEETLGVLELLSEELGKTREEVVGLLRRMKNEKEGGLGTNVVPRCPKGRGDLQGLREDVLGVLRATPPPPPRAPRGPEGGPGGGHPPLHRRPGAQEGEGPSRPGPGSWRRPRGASP